MRISANFREREGNPKPWTRLPTPVAWFGGWNPKPWIRNLERESTRNTRNPAKSREREGNPKPWTRNLELETL